MLGLSNLAVALGLALVVAASPSAAALARESRPVAAIDRVVLRAVGDLEITQGADEGLIVEAEARLMGQIKTEVRDGTLTIDIVGREFRTREPVRYLLRVKRISAIEATSSGSTRVARLAADRLRLIVSGSADLRIDTLTAATLAVDITGSASVEIGSGRVGAQDIRMKGAAQYAAPALRSGDARVEIDGSGEAVVAAEKSLTAAIRGSGRVAYRGDPVVKQNIDGAGSIEREGSL